MGTIYKRNKKTDITYAYRNEAYWDKEKKQSRTKRILIGKVDPDTGDIVLTRAYRKKQNSLVKVMSRQVGGYHVKVLGMYRTAMRCPCEVSTLPNRQGSSL